MDQLSSSENWPASQSGDSNSSDCKPAEHAKNLEGSAELKTNESSARTYDLIVEEPEEDVSRSESVEQLSESISKIDSVGDSFEKENVTPKGSDNNSTVQERRPKAPSPQKCFKSKSEFISRSIQTSHFSEIASLKNAHKTNLEFSKPTIKVIEQSFLNKLKMEGEVQKPVYVLYPNYVLPDLDFLNEKDELSKLLLLPQKAPNVTSAKKRPFSCNDLETLKRKGFGHVKDWDSLNFLLPQEYRQILSEVPEISEHIKTNAKEKPSFVQNKFTKRRPLSCEINQTNISSSSSTATQPSSGYRGSSSLLTDSQNSPANTTNLNPLFVYRYDSVTSSEASLMNSDRQHSITTTAPPLPLRCVSLGQGESVPPRPPLPRGILRKGMEKADPNKRYSMYETSEEEILEDPSYKRKSFPEPYYLQRYKKLSETEDEGVDAGTSSSSLDEHPECPPHRNLLSNISTDELVQLEEFLKLSGISTSDEEHTEESLIQLRSYVSKFLSLKINQEGAEHFGGKKCVSFAEKINVMPKLLEAKQFIPPNNSPNVSAFLHQKNYQVG